MHEITCRADGLRPGQRVTTLYALLAGKFSSLLNRNVGGANLEAVDEVFRFWNQIAEADAKRHGGKDPDGQISVKKREFSGDGNHGRPLGQLSGMKRAKQETWANARPRLSAKID